MASYDPTSGSPAADAGDAPQLTRRHVLTAGAATLAAAAVPGAASASGSSLLARHSRYVYVGTYTGPGTAPGGTSPSSAVGIYVFRLDARSGTLVALPALTQPVSNPSYLAVHPSLTTLYCVQENSDGRVSAFRISAATGGLSSLNDAGTGGQNPTHLSLTPSGRHLLAANYSSGSFPVYRLRADGSIGRRTDMYQGRGNGTGPHPERQEAPHAHQVISRTDRGVTRVFGVDLGADRIYALTLDPATGSLTPGTVPYANAASGSGPRHMAFHPRGRIAYVLNELASTITVFTYDPARGSFTWSQTLPTLPGRYTGANTTAEIRIHPNGRFLYSTNRGHDSVTMFRVEPRSGRLEVMGWQSTRGDWPRGMNLDPSGSFLHVANQNSDSIAAFRITPATGRLRLIGVVRTPTPVDIAYGPLI